MPARPPHDVESEESRSFEPEPGSPTPRWVRLFGLATLVLVVLFALLHLSGRGLGPGAHMPSRQPELQQP